MPFSVMPMKPMVIGPKRLTCRSRKDRRAVACDDVGGEVAEARPGERLDRTRVAAGKLRAAARLHPLQLVAASVEFVIADRIEFEPEQVHREMVGSSR